MNTVFAISLVVLLLWWIAVVEMPQVYGLLVSTSAIRRWAFAAISIVAMSLVMLLPATERMAYGLVATYGGMDINHLALVVVSAFVSMLLLRRWRAVGSLWLAMLGALEVYRLTVGHGEVFNASFVGSWLLAPLVSAVVAALLCLLYKFTLERAHIHLIKLSVHLRVVVIVGIALVGVAIGINNGATLMAMAAMVEGVGTLSAPLFALLVAVILLLLNRLVRHQSDFVAQQYGHLTTQTVIVVSYAVSASLLIFSSSLPERMGLSTTPLGIVPLVCGALLGVALVQRREQVERVWVRRTMSAMVLSPLFAMLCYYVMSLVLSMREASSGMWSVSIVMFGLLVILVAVFGSYVRRQERSKQSTQRLLYSQQQQLYESQKALNDLELKAILAENQSLHGTLELKRKEIVNVALGISEQKEFLEFLAEKVHRAGKAKPEERDRLIAEIENDLVQRINYSGEIDEFYTQVEMLHKDFSVKLTEEFPNLTTSERRLATLLRLGFSSKYIATLMNISPKSVEISRYRLRQKLGLQRTDNLINFIKAI